MSMIVYGIPNCSKVKKAREWLDGSGVAYKFHDYKKDGVDESKLKEWSSKIGWKDMLNTKGTTWRGMSDDEKASITTEAKALKLMMQNPSIIRRPLIEQGKDIRLGFDETEYKKWFPKFA